MEDKDLFNVISECLEHLQVKGCIIFNNPITEVDKEVNNFIDIKIRLRKIENDK